MEPLASHETASTARAVTRPPKVPAASRAQAAMRKEIGQRLRAARLAAGLTQDAVAELAGLSREHVSRVETGQRQNLTMETLGALARAVGLELQVLLDPPVPPIPRKRK